MVEKKYSISLCILVYFPKVVYVLLGRAFNPLKMGVKFKIEKQRKTLKLGHTR